MLCKDRVFEAFRSLYTLRPTQGCVLRRRLVCKAEVAEYASISGMAICDRNMLAQEGIAERIPGLSVQFVNQITFNRSRLLALQLQGRNSYAFSTFLFSLFSTFLKH